MIEGQGEHRAAARIVDAARFEQAKRAFGPGDVSEQLLRLERSPWGCPRILLAAAIHHLLRSGLSGAAHVLREYLASFAPPAESLSAEELEELEAMERLPRRRAD